MRRICLVSVGLAAAAFLALSSSASATDLTSPTGTVSTPTIELTSEGHIGVHTGFSDVFKPAECAWKLVGTVEKHGNANSTVVPLKELTMSGCTNSWHLTTVTAGTLEITWTSGYNGTVTWSGATLSVTRSSITCFYSLENTHVGTLTGGSPATLHIEGKLPRESGSPACDEPEGLAPWTGDFTVASPSALYVDKSGTTITSPTGTVATPSIKAESEGHIGIDHPLTTIQCQWSLEGTVESHQGSAVIPLSSLSTSGCTDSWHATTVTKGKLEISSTSGYNGTVRWTEGTVELTRSGTTCRYKSDKTVIGTITGGTPATIDIEGKLPPDGGSPLCGEEGYPLTGSLKVTTPTSLFVDKAS